MTGRNWDKGHVGINDLHEATEVSPIAKAKRARAITTHNEFPALPLFLRQHRRRVMPPARVQVKAKPDSLSLRQGATVSPRPGWRSGGPLPIVVACWTFAAERLGRRLGW